MSTGGRSHRFLAWMTTLTLALTAAGTISTRAASPASTRAAGACPYSSSSLSAAMASPSTLLWMNPTYQSSRTPDELAQEVLSCEQIAQPDFTKRFPALLALISLNNSANSDFQNINMYLKDSTGALTFYPDFRALGIPALTLEDGPGGIVHRSPTGHPQPVIYPNELALAASFDPALAQAYGQELGVEARALNFLGVQAPDLNLDRIPNWGRSPETFGEDPVLAGLMGTAEALGVLQRDSFVVLKHFGTYGQETSRKSTNNLVPNQALHDTYLRPFAMAMQDIAASSVAPSTGQVALMCSYGDLNTSRSCTNTELTKTLGDLPFSGLVRSDLDTVTTATDLLSGSVNLIKPLVSNEFAPYTNISSRVQGEVNAAAVELLSVLFAAKLVNPTTWSRSMTIGAFTTALHNAGVALANQIVARGAVLLKNSTIQGAPGLGSLPITASEGPLTIVAPLGLGQTCLRLAQWVSLHSARATCAIWNRSAVAATTLAAGLPASATTALTHSVVWVAPASGPYLVTTTTYGNSSLTLNGAPLEAQPGISSFYAGNDTTIQAVKGGHYHFVLSWHQTVGPTLTISPLAPDIATAVTALKGSKMAVVLGYDMAAEGGDRFSLSMPYGQDSIISAVASTVPTSVALVTTGPVTMPWLPAVKSVIELWNPVGYVPVDFAVSSYVPAYGQLLTGLTSPTGHLPLTFPASMAASPMNVGAQHYGYWPGLNGVANLALSPDNGLVIGYGWYQSAKWPVLFPFGFGLSYATTTTSFSTKSTCASSSAQICLEVSVHFGDIGRPARDAVQVYVAQPNPNNNRPTLVLGTATSIDCRDLSGPTGRCSPGAMTPVTIAANAVGPWSESLGNYQFATGCYTFVVAPDAQHAFSVLATPALAPSSVVQATYNGTIWTAPKAGKC